VADCAFTVPGVTDDTTATTLADAKNFRLTRFISESFFIREVLLNSGPQEHITPSTTIFLIFLFEEFYYLTIISPKFFSCIADTKRWNEQNLLRITTFDFFLSLFENRNYTTTPRKC